MNNQINKKGFTLIELLVVIAIIGLLSSVVLSSLKTAKDKAKVASVARDIRNIETSLYLWVDNLGGFPTKADNPSIKNLLGSSPEFLFNNDGVGYRYDNDGDESQIKSCLTTDKYNVARGVNILVLGIDKDIFWKLDSIFDGPQSKDSDDIRKNCGKITANQWNANSANLLIHIKPNRLFK